LRKSTTICFGLAAAFALVGEPALAQVYSWKDPATGQSRLSNIAPPWYSHGEMVGGPRVIATLGARVIDDTALAYEDRRLLFGKPKDRSDKLRPQQPGSAAAQAPKQEGTGTGADDRRPADQTASRGVSGAGS